MTKERILEILEGAKDKTASVPMSLVRKAFENISNEQQWILCSERLPDEDHWLGGSGKQFSDNVLISVVNCNDEDAWVQVSQTIDGTWALELPRYCKVLAWMPLPEPYQPKEE